MYGRLFMAIHGFVNLLWLKVIFNSVLLLRVKVVAILDSMLDLQIPLEAWEKICREYVYVISSPFKAYSSTVTYLNHVDMQDKYVAI